MPNEQITPSEVEQEPKPAKVEFSEIQQTKIQQIIRETSASAGREARLEAERLRAELDLARKTQAPAEDTLVALATARAEVNSLRADKEEASIQDVLRSAVGDNFLDSQLAAQILRPNIRVIEGKPNRRGLRREPAS